DDRLARTILVRQLYAGQRREGGHVVQAADDVVVPRSGLDLRAPGHRGHAVAALTHGALGAAERGVAGVWVHVLPGAVVGGPEHVRVLVEAERADLVQDATDPGVILHE